MGIRALVACTERLFLVDLDTHQIEVIEDHRGEYYGISWPADGSRLCLSHTGLDTATLDTLEKYVNSERGSLSVGGQQTDPILSAPHQILCADEFIVATNTGRNCLTMVRLEDLFYRQYWHNETRWDRTSVDNMPGNHLNSVYREGDRLYVVAHNHNRGSQVWVLAWPEMTLLETINTAALGAHNLWLEEGGGILICDSMHGRIIEARSGRVLWNAGDDAILRGVARIGRRLWVGDSARCPRDGRKHADGVIYALNPTTWEVRDKIEMPCCGSIHEIRLIDQPDSCHHGFPLRVPVRGDAESLARYQEAVVKVRSEQANRVAFHSVARSLGWMWRQGEVDEVTETSVAIKPPNLLILTRLEPEAQDVRVEAQITLPSDAAAQHVGLVARYRGPEDRNMVAGLIYRVGTRIRADIWRHFAGAWSMLAGETVPTETETFSLALEALGPELKLFLGGELIVQVRDPDTVWAGATGVRGVNGKVDDWAARSIVSEPVPAENHV